MSTTRSAARGHRGICTLVLAALPLLAHAQPGSFGGGSGLATANIQSTRQNLAEVLTLAVEVLREPALSDEELELIRQARTRKLEYAVGQFALADAPAAPDARGRRLEEY